jgi:light-regulated signal transduction histidine kinase (bacteriophytochrome)
MVSEETLQQVNTASAISTGLDLSIKSQRVFNFIHCLSDELASENIASIEELCRLACRLILLLAPYARVMIYQFDHEWHGKVIHEVVSPETDRLYPEFGGIKYAGLKFPSSDIPQQARQLYILNRIRNVVHRSSKTARLIRRRENLDEDSQVPFDMSHCYLRAVSPVHLKYQANIGVVRIKKLACKTPLFFDSLPSPFLSLSVSKD